MRMALLFKDGITRPAAAISAPIVMESVRVERAGEGVHTPPKIIHFASSRRSLTATFTIAAAWRGPACEAVCGKGGKLDGRRNLRRFDRTQNSTPRRT